MGKKRRKHLQQQMNDIQNISHDCDGGGNIGTLIITKTTKTGDSEAHNF